MVDVALAEDTTARTLTFTRTAGGRAEVTVFNSMTAATAPGGFVSHTDARGVVTTVTAQTGARIDELQRSYTSGGTTTYESLLYSYFNGGDKDGKVVYVTYRRKVGAGAWSELTRMTYDYYGTSDANGSQKDLRWAARQLPNGSGGWLNAAEWQYRYYKSGDAHGAAHCLKLHCGPEACRRMFNDGVNPDTASDATVQAYADHYFEYDPLSREVTKEVSAVCDSCPGGGTTSDTFAYTSNPRAPQEND